MVIEETALYTSDAKDRTSEVDHIDKEVSKSGRGRGKSTLSAINKEEMKQTPVMKDLITFHCNINLSIKQQLQKQIDKQLKGRKTTSSSWQTVL